jgi:hypothetical protein
LLFLPWPRLPSAGSQPNWLDGFLGELMFWGLASSMVVLTVSLNVIAFECVLWPSFSLSWIVHGVRRRPEAPSPASEN